MPFEEEEDYSISEEEKKRRSSIPPARPCPSSRPVGVLKRKEKTHLKKSLLPPPS